MPFQNSVFPKIPGSVIDIPVKVRTDPNRQNRWGWLFIIPTDFRRAWNSRMFTKFALSVGAILILVALGCGSPAFPILFTSDTDGNLEIYSVPKDGARPTRLTFNTTDDNQPVWFPGGKQIAFVSYLDGCFEVENELISRYMYLPMVSAWLL